MTLPNSEIPISISNAYWQRSVSWDARKWIAPKIYFEPMFADFENQKDPVMIYLEEILTARKDRKD